MARMSKNCSFWLNTLRFHLAPAHYWGIVSGWPDARLLEADEIRCPPLRNRRRSYIAAVRAAAHRHGSALSTTVPMPVVPEHLDDTRRNAAHIAASVRAALDSSSATEPLHALRVAAERARRILPIAPDTFLSLVCLETRRRAVR
ncbi:MAG: hypothetical protein Q7T01_00650 [bacterium]|nr:hypothetical protein [bacterium]